MNSNAEKNKDGNSSGMEDTPDVFNNGVALKPYENNVNAF